MPIFQFIFFPPGYTLAGTVSHNVCLFVCLSVDKKVVHNPWDPSKLFITLGIHSSSNSHWSALSQSYWPELPQFITLGIPAVAVIYHAQLS